MKTLCSIQLDCQAHAKAEAQKDLSFAMGAGIKHLSATDQAAIMRALVDYASNGAARAIQFASTNGWIKGEL